MSNEDLEATDEIIEAHGSVLDFLSNKSVFNAGLTEDKQHLFLIDGCDAVFPAWLRKPHVARLIAELQALHDQMPGESNADLAKHNQALRECLAYARSKRSKDFDFDTWDAMCKSAMAGAQAPSALENEIALHAQTRDALIAVRKERDALLVDTCHGAMCGKCLLCRVRSIHGCPARPNAKLKQP